MSDKTVAFRPRFAAAVDASLRSHIRRRGELVQLITLILRTADLSSVPLIELGSDLRHLATTTVKLPASLHKQLKKIAEHRDSSMNVLVNSAVWAYTQEQNPQPPEN